MYLYTQPSWCSLLSWPHSDITSLGRSVTCTFLASPFFYSRDVFWDRIYILGYNTQSKCILIYFPSSSQIYICRLHCTKAGLLNSPDPLYSQSWIPGTYTHHAGLVTVCQNEGYLSYTQQHVIMFGACSIMIICLVND